MQISGSASIALSLLRAGDLMNRKSATGATDEIDRILSAQRNANAAPPTSEKKPAIAPGESAGMDAGGDYTLTSAAERFAGNVYMLSHIFNDQGTWEDSIAKSKKTMGFLISVVRNNNLLNHIEDYRKMVDPAKIAAKIDDQIEWAKSKGYKDLEQEYINTRQQRIDEKLEIVKKSVEQDIYWAKRSEDSIRFELGLASPVAGASLRTDENGDIKINAFQQKDSQGRVVAEMKADGTVTMYNEDGSVRETQTRQQLAIQSDSNSAGVSLDLGYFIDLTDEQLSVYW